jgi:hypothetical protein
VVEGHLVPLDDRHPGIERRRLAVPRDPLRVMEVGVLVRRLADRSRETP